MNMNFLKRAITAQLPLSYRSSRKCLFLFLPITQSSLYSTTYRLNNPQPSKPRRPREPTPPPSSSPSILSQRVKDQAEVVADWPRPSEIPYQAKVTNLVNLIGHIKTPIKFQSSSDGKSCAGTIISQENGLDKSCLIPILFEGDLAHVATYHVKKNDCVYVIGQLSEDPLPFVLSESQGNFHVVVQNINFVQGFEKKAFEKRSNVVVRRNCDSNYTSDAVSKKSGGDSGVSIDSTDFSSDEEICFGTNMVSANTVKDETSTIDSWRDLVKNPKQWWDYREQKFKGSASGKHPDFKRKDSGTALWLDSAPKWVLPGLERLEFDVSPPRQTRLKGAKEEVWKSLVENPSQWWDNRLNKKNQKAPDFKHKETGEVLWLSSSPQWVLSKLPPPKEKRTAGAV